MDRRAAATLAAAGYDPSRHRAQQFAGSWLEEYDLLLAMDAQNLRDLRRGDEATRPGADCSATSILSNPGATCPTRTTVGTAASRRCWTMVERTSAEIVEALRRRLVDGAGGP